VTRGAENRQPWGVELRYYRLSEWLEGIARLAKLAGKIEDGGKKALAHNCAVQMATHGFGDKDIHLVGVIVVTKGHYALNMRNIASRGRPGPGGETYHQDDKKEG
jgi:hypothetical protein